MADQRICNSPCIIGNQHGYLSVFCALPHGHETEWCFVVQGARDRVRIQWRYTGVAEARHSPSAGREVCGSPVCVEGRRLDHWSLTPRHLDGRKQEDEPPHRELYICCQGQPTSKEPFRAVHIGHECNGRYEPLGIEWKIRW